MRKKNHARSALMKVIGLICILLLVVVLLFVLDNGNKMDKKKQRNLVSLFEIFSPPKDLYQDLVCGELVFSKTKAVFEFNYEHKYNGKHNAGIYLENFTYDLYAKSYLPKMKVEIAFYCGSNIILSKNVEEFTPFLSKDGGGYMLLSYSVPDDLPNKDTIKCKVKILDYDSELEAKHGPLRFYIRKMSDK